ncbi:ribonucleotide reductase M1 [Reticulomyxa filosa]|uniref:Ribonucleoside-diphosphate reductase n=1 Tax=Reticulomyxa filosa TaxID=46433 RepID=X6PC66_RETFI|nr:ribonucleotide reductase M1 [Reticulomyxa filosa]|eukprot:ETO35262.1 ribonucleotide reductase M1 [Reticulomyxa filosa]
MASSRTTEEHMYVIKRCGQKEAVHFDKITSRIKKLCWGLSEVVDPVQVAIKVCGGVYKGVTTVELDELAAQTAAHMVTVHPDYGELAARIEVSNLHKTTLKNLSDVADVLYRHRNPNTDESEPLIDEKLYTFIVKHKEKLDKVLVHERDYEYDYFGIKTLQYSYLLRANGKIVERPQHMLMRVSLGIHLPDIDAALETYNCLSQKWIIHASPTLFNAGTPRPQLSSCFLLTMKEDSIEGVYDTLKQCAQISKYGGGIGIAAHCIRATGSYVHGTNGTANGIVPMLRVFNDTAKYINQGPGKRKGNCFLLLLLKTKNHGSEEERTRDLFLALWVPDLFMNRVKNDEIWSLMCPNECKGLFDVWGEEFEKLYCFYESKQRYRKQIKARQLWTAIIHSQIETGVPYMVYKGKCNLDIDCNIISSFFFSFWDCLRESHFQYSSNDEIDHCNRKSNQQNLGTIKSSNLCTEIVEYTSPDEIAVLTRNLNKIIDINYYPMKEAKTSNLKHRPIGIGVQGLADVFILLRFPFESTEAQKLNRDIFEAIYFGAVTTSCELAKIDGPYQTYPGSPASKGKLQFDLWGVKPSDRWDWTTLKENISKYGVHFFFFFIFTFQEESKQKCHTYEQILGNNECFEPYTNNVYIRRTLAGEFVCLNAHLLRDLIALDIWNESLKNKILFYHGSIQSLKEIPDELKLLYKTVWEIPQKIVIDMALARGPFVDQSQSLNIYMNNCNYGKLSSMHFYGWSRGLKTGMYYLRTKPAAHPIQFTVDKEAIEKELSLQQTKENKQTRVTTPTSQFEKDKCDTCG